MRIPSILLLTSLCLGAQTPAILEGKWTGSLQHQGRTSPLGFRFSPADQGRVQVSLSLPAIHLAEAPMGAWKPSQEGVEFQLGPFRFTWNHETQTFSGCLPESLVPVYRIPFEVRKGAPPPAPERAPLEGRPADPVWTYEAGSALWAGGRWDSGRFLAGTEDGRMLGLDAQGRLRWTYATKAPIRCRPTLWKGSAYFLSDDGYLHRIRVWDGRAGWKVRVADRPAQRLPFDNPKSRYDRFAAEVVATDSELFVGTHEGRVLCLDPATGRERWRFQTGDAVLAAPGLDARSVYAGSYDGKVYALDRRNGRLRWQVDTLKPVVSTPTPWRNHLLVGSRSYELLGLDTRTGAKLWNHYLWMSWIESSPTLEDGIAYVGSSDAAVVLAIGATDGKVVWSKDVRGWSWGQPALSPEIVYACTSSSVGYGPGHQAGVLALDRKSGQVCWHHVLPAPAKGPYGLPGSPALGPDLVFVTSLDGRILAFRR